MITRIQNPKTDPRKVVDELMSSPKLIVSALQFIRKKPDIEQGCFVQFSSNIGEYLLFECSNENEGNPQKASIEFNPTPEEYDRIYTDVEKGIFLVASLHSHPRGLPVPSTLDRDELFPSCLVNFIYATSVGQLAAYSSGCEHIQSFNVSVET